MPVHAHSIEAYHGLDLPTRCRTVLAALDSIGGRATDRQVAEAMETEDMNMARPRITEMVAAGILAEVGHTRDQHTGRTVRVVGWAS
jgi:hypothetical protein